MKLDTILVPLDGSALAESAIPIKKGLRGHGLERGSRPCTRL